MPSFDPHHWPGPLSCRVTTSKLGITAMGMPQLLLWCCKGKQTYLVGLTGETLDQDSGETGLVRMQTVVIGGGIVGLTTAYHLAREGVQVTVLDARATGHGASDVNAGWIVPAEAAPVPGPGVVLTSMKWMLRPDSPLYIRPSLHPQFLSFLFGMWRASNARRQRAGFAGHLALAESTVETFDDYRADGMDFEMHSTGLLMAFTQRANLDHHLTHLDLVKKYGLEPTVLEGDDVRVHEPLLSDAVQGGLFFPKERHVDPGTLARALHRRLVDLGADLVEYAPLTAVERDGDRITAVRSHERTFSGDAYLLAAGAWTGPLSRQFGVPLPVRPGKGYSVDVEPLAMRSATNLSDAKVAVTPLTRNLRLAGTMEFGGLDEDINQVRVDAILRAPAIYFRDWQPPATPPKPSAGMRPMTPDGLPIMGRLGRLSNGFVSTGHGMLGVTLAPGSAAVMTELILHDTASPRMAPFTPRRFRSAR
ncbi:FAD-dependent oxidoreductase [Phytohabitans sp. ZYX-F-186]|uniref:FAD-dependent oxidoreductase n=1 Tax=Phytohabitans maris TaxID=3071409 RepID=A0ABU0ZPZ5_9ACTN|nr:FAD-dependent oxidoreductase [Phytohabitans sp. ZYX-F-186]MDQ7909023.1 FAD-dependent oxidoreductase [Phytohabitans sp. ZYX-F-186]